MSACTLVWECIEVAEFQVSQTLEEYLESFGSFLCCSGTIQVIYFALIAVLDFFFFN